MNDMFKDKVILITGAAAGFGQILARRMGALGGKLVLGDINLPALDEVADELRAAGVEVEALRCDITSEADAAAMVARAIEVFGRLDIAVNNAGVITPMKSLVDIDEAEFDFNMNVNAKGLFFGLKHQLRQMREQRQGVVLNVASLAGLGAAPKLAAYGAAKHAAVGLTRTAAIEFAKYGVRVNAICPFYSPTSMVTTDLQLDQEFSASMSPMKRLPTPEEVVETMISIISPTNTYLNGQAIALDGGISAI